MDSLLEREKQLRELNKQLDEQQIEVDRQAESALMPQSSSIANAAEEMPVASKPSRSPANRTRGGAAPDGSTAAAPSPPAPVSAASSQPKARPQPASSPAPEAGADMLPDMAEIGPDAMVRFQKAQLSVLREELEQMAASQRDTEEELAAVQVQLEKTQRQQRESARGLAQAKVALEKQRELCQAADVKAADTQRLLAATTKELDAMKRDARKKQAAGSTRDVRLNRALEDVERYKSMLAEARASGKVGSDHARKDHERVVAENRKLTRQKAELLSAFKKQLRLIDVLKRQKLHMEAAKMLSFTEDEFSRLLSC